MLEEEEEEEEEEEAEEDERVVVSLLEFSTFGVEKSRNEDNTNDQKHEAVQQ